MFLRTGCQHDDGDVFTARVRAQPARERSTGKVRQHPVEKDEIRSDIPYQGICLTRAMCALHVMAGVLEIYGNQFLDGRLILDDEYLAAH
jgi:hypothetical protein